MDANRNKRIRGLGIAAGLLFFTLSAHLQAQQPPAPQVRMRWQG
jgi:hypothetical protein